VVWLGPTLRWLWHAVCYHPVYRGLNSTPANGVGLPPDWVLDAPWVWANLVPCSVSTFAGHRVPQHTVSCSYRWPAAVSAYRHRCWKNERRLPFILLLCLLPYYRRAAIRWQIGPTVSDPGAFCSITFRRPHGAATPVCWVTYRTLRRPDCRRTVTMQHALNARQTVSTTTGADGGALERGVPTDRMFI